MASGHKLAIVTSHPIQYNAPVFRALAAIGIDVRVFYTWSQTASGEQFDQAFGQKVGWDVPLLDGYAHEFVPNLAAEPGLHHFRGLNNPALIARIEAWGADAVLVYGWNYRSHLRAMRHFKGRRPVLFRGDSTLLGNRAGPRTLLRRALLRWVYRHIDIALAVGTLSRRYFEWCGVAVDNVRLAPHCVDNQRFASGVAAHEANARARRTELGIPDSGVVALFAGKFQPQKNLPLLLRAMQRIDGNLYLVLAGAGELEPVLRAQAAGHPRICFVPFANQSQMPGIYRTADVVVMPSQSETWGLALNEAMACSRAVIASDRVGGATDLIAPGENGWLFPSGNEMALADLLRSTVALGRTRLAEMGAAGGERVAAWSVESCAARIAEVVDEQLAGRLSPSGNNSRPRVAAPQP